MSSRVVFSIAAVLAGGISATQAQVSDSPSGVVLFEAENCNANISHTDAAGTTRTWLTNTFFPGYSGTSYLESLPNTGALISAANAPNQSPQLQYNVNFTSAGNHYVWVRMEADPDDGTGDDSCWVGINSTSPGTANSTPLTTTVRGAWQWIRSSSINLPASGNRIVSIYMDKDGLRVDRLLVTTNNAFQSATGIAWHIPSSAEVPAGLTMRKPLSPNAGTNISIFNGSVGNQSASGSTLFFKRAGDSSWSSAPMAFTSANGSSNYYLATLSASLFQTGDTIEYYLQAWFTDRLPTFICYSNNTSRTTEIETDAQANPFTFTVGPVSDPPIATTTGVSPIGSTNATFNGNVNPRGAVSTAWFQYGLTTNYTAASLATNLLVGTNPLLISIAVNSLAAGSNYHFRIVATNVAGLATGSDFTFNTPAVSVTTMEPTAGSATGMTLNGQVLPNGFPSSVWFEWGNTTNYGNSTPRQNLGSTTSATNFSQSLTGRVTGATCHYRAAAASAFDTNYGGAVLFTPLFQDINAAVPQILGQAAWGDFDNDGRLDIWLTGQTNSTTNVVSQGTAQVWRNSGTSFTNINAALTWINGQTALAVADFDNDGSLDVLLAGSNGAQGWRNTPSGFTPAFGFGGPVDVAFVVPADYDNDGALDVFFPPLTPGTYTLWKNTNGGFAQVAAPFPPAYDANAAWTDYDRDGRPDLLLIGNRGQKIGTYGDLINQLWRNTGSGFASVPVPFPGLARGAIAWGDFDNDGWLDVVFSGATMTNSGASPSDFTTQLWRNNTGAGFVFVTNFPGAGHSSMTWGDYDNDGRLDLVLMGEMAGGSSAAFAQIWHNTTNGFVNIGAGLPQLTHGSVCWGDYDNDGRLDLLMTGIGRDGLTKTVVLRNNAAIPTRPVLTISRTDTNIVQFSWNTNFARYQLESTPWLYLTNTLWTPVPGGPVSTGSQYFQSDFSTTQRFYRLRR